MDLKIRAALSVCITMTFFSAPAFAQGEPSPQTTDFVHTVSVGNAFEIESSRLALKKTSAKDVKDFAQMMVADHTQIGDQLRKALALSSTGLSADETLDGDPRKMLDELNAAPAADFDNLYVQTQSKADDEAVSFVADYAENGDNMSLKKFASDTLPVLKKHQELVHTLTQSFMSTRQ